MESSSATPDHDGDDYAVIRVSVSWGALSILAFLALMALQVFGYRFFQIRLLHGTLATFALAVVGSVLGLVGLRIGRSRGTARVGLFLNAAVLFCLFVLLPLISQVLRRLG